MVSNEFRYDNLQPLCRDTSRSRDLAVFGFLVAGGLALGCGLADLRRARRSADEPVPARRPRATKSTPHVVVRQDIRESTPRRFFRVGLAARTYVC